MKIIDRYILKRFFGNFLLLFCLLFLFAAGIEVIINLDEYVKSAQARTEEGAGAVRSLAVLLALIVDFEAPRILLLYAYLHGVVAIGAMAFTLAQMHRQKELVALLASGVSLKRLALPFVAAVLLISLVQVANQELLLHRVAPLLLRSHGNAGRQTIEEFPVRFTKDGSKNLFQSPTFHPDTSEFIDVTILERDEAGARGDGSPPRERRGMKRGAAGSWRTAWRSAFVQPRNETPKRPGASRSTSIQPIWIPRPSSCAAAPSMRECSVCGRSGS